MCKLRRNGGSINEGCFVQTKTMRTKENNSYKFAVKAKSN